MGRAENRKTSEGEESATGGVLSQSWSRSAEDVLRELDVDASAGLDAASVKVRRKRYGPNRLRQRRRESAWRVLGRQFRSLLVVLLIIAAGVSFAFGQWEEGVAIAAVVVINAAIGFATELKAVRSMEALRRLGKVTTRVRRGGRVQEIAAEELVGGDIVVFEGGDVVPADLRLIEASKLQADESALTGESVPVTKRVDAVAADADLAERKSLLFKGTAVTRGSGVGVVVRTGMSTEVGRIASMVEEAEGEQTPLEKRLDALGGKLVWITLGIAGLVTAAGTLSGKGLILMIETGIALAVATVPEGLPIVATIALARGMWRMARRNALINRLSAVETLGATSVICTDKTGTLTENRMTVTRLLLASGAVDVRGDGDAHFVRGDVAVDARSDRLLRTALEIGVLCSNAALPKESGDGGDARPVGEPLEVALLEAAAKAGLRRPDLVEREPEVREEAFDTETRMMATFHEVNGRCRVAVKGAPEAVLGVSTQVLTNEGERDLREQERQQWQKSNEEMAAAGLRVLALATKRVDSAEARAYVDVTFVGLVGLLDPPRRDVRQAIAACRDAGIRVVMVTGDQAGTARRIGEDLGLIEEGRGSVISGKELRTPRSLGEDERRRILAASIFARVNPRQKLDLIAVHQAAGAIVAMTGDGVNDAPALEKADIGVAMGQRGTQVAAEAADMVLRDDAFGTIVAAVRHGRIVFNNIRKFVFYLLSCNVSEVMVVTLASLIDAPLPIRPLQILFLNLVTDVFPALALGVGEGDPRIMEAPPRDPKEPVLTRGHWLAIGAYGMLITAAVLGALGIAFEWLGMDETRAVTVSFLTLAFAQLWHVFNMRDPGSSFWRNDIVRNPFVWGALALCGALLLMAVYVPGLAGILDVASPGPSGWIAIIGLGLAPLVAGEGWRKVVAVRHRRSV